ncbi:MAG: histidine phosphatase family protein [Cyanobacteria bacterium P01_F01_bin.86]
MLSTRIIFVRHGRSTYNEQGRYQGSSNQAVLIADGYRTARLVGQALQAEKIDAIYASPLKRVQQTVEVIREQLPHDECAIAFREDLREIDLPAWEGLPYETVRTHQVDDYRCWIERPHEFQMAPIPQAESFYPVRDLYQRAQQFWQDVLPGNAGKTLLVVSHGGTIHALISTALGLTPDQHHCLQQSNCGISILEFTTQTNTVQLSQMNDTGILGEVLPKLKAGRQGLRLLFLPVEPNTLMSGVCSLLELVHLDFSLQTHGLISDFQTAQLLKNHPETVPLQIQRDDFIQVWQQTLTLRQQSEGLLITGLIIASPQQVEDLLRQIVGIPTRAEEALTVSPGKISVVHYADSQPRPILQGLNIHTSKLDQNANCGKQTLLATV